MSDAATPTAAFSTIKPLFTRAKTSALPRDGSSRFSHLKGLPSAADAASAGRSVKYKIKPPNRPAVSGILRKPVGPSSGEEYTAMATPDSSDRETYKRVRGRRYRLDSCSAVGAWRPCVITHATSTTLSPAPPPARETPNSVALHGERKTNGVLHNRRSELCGRLCELVNLRRRGKQCADLHGEPAGNTHPLVMLHFLGTAQFNNAPLTSFLVPLSLRTTQGTATRATSSAAGSTQGSCSVHLYDVEGRYFQVVASTAETSPLCGLMQRGSYGRHAAWDGAVFCLEPLEDHDNAVLSKASEVEYFSVSVEQPKLSSPLRIVGPVDLQRGQPPAASFYGRLPEITPVKNTLVSFAPTSHMTSTERQSSEDGHTAPGGTTSEAITSLSTTLKSSLFGAMDASPAQRASRTQNVPLWKRYCTAAALYFALVEAGICDGRCFPFLPVHLVCWGDLLRDSSVRLEALACGAPATIARMQRALTRANKCIPMAVTLPMERKGALRWPVTTTTSTEEALDNSASTVNASFETTVPHRELPSTSVSTTVTAPPFLTSQAFTDAEVFQLFYLQLVFRAYADIRFPHMSLEVDALCDRAAAQDSRAPQQRRRYLRADLLGVTSSGSQGIAFEFPESDRDGHLWLLFPPHTRLLTLLDLSGAVIPLYATTTELRETASLPLFGASSDVRCLSRRGRAVVQWAGQQVVDSPEAALQALRGLFDAFAEAYGCRRENVWRAAAAPTVLRCCPSTTVQVFHASDPALLRFLTPAVLRSVTKNSTRSPERPQSATEDVALRRKPTMANADGDQLDASERTSRPSLSEPSRANSFSAVAHDAHDIKSSELPTAVAAEEADAALADDASEDTEIAFSHFTSPNTHQENLVTRWRHYTSVGNADLFNGTTDGIRLLSVLGKGGSGLVYRGTYGSNELPVAVKIFVWQDGASYADYVRESLTDVASYVLFNQLDDYGICRTARAHDFIISEHTPRGLSQAEADLALHGREATSTKLCYFVTELMEGTLGRFLTEDEADFDPCYDTLVNSPLEDAELFQFLFTQLAARSLFDLTVLDVMLNGQLRGDNIGYRHLHPSVSPRDAPALVFSDTSPRAPAGGRSYNGILLAYRFSTDAPLRYLRFPADLPSGATLRFINFIDLGQGIQPSITELTKRRLIGETVVDSCVQDDGFGRYWPLNELYCRYIDVSGDFAAEVVEWGQQQRIDSPGDAGVVLEELIRLYASKYGADNPTPEELATYCVLTWTPQRISELKSNYVYRSD